MAGSSRPDVFRFMAANVTGKAHECLLLLFFASDAHLVGINHDHEITGIDVWSEDGFLLSAQKIRGLDGNTAKHLIFRVDDPPRSEERRVGKERRARRSPHGYSSRKPHHERRGR